MMDRFWSKVQKTNTCWIWLAGKNHYGYGSYAVLRDGEWFRAQAHRVAYEALVGPIPVGLTLDHLCRNRACVNPAHLEPITKGANVLRGESPAACHARGERCGKCASCGNAEKTQCKHGHPLSGGNLYIAKNGMRACRECSRLRMAERRRTKAAV